MRVADLHCDTVYRLLEGADLSIRGADEQSASRGATPPDSGHIDIPRMRDGDVGLQVFAAFVPHSTASGEAFALARTITGKAPISLKKAKQLLADAQVGELAEALDRETEGILDCMKTEDWQEGVDAFAEKRPPVYKGR